MVIDLEQEIPAEQLINPEQKEKHLRLEFKEGRTYEYDELTIASASGKSVGVCFLFVVFFVCEKQLFSFSSSFCPVLLYNMWIDALSSLI